MPPYVRTDATTALGPARPGLFWLNSPSNPTGRVLPPAHLRKVVEWARARGTVVASDECYLSLAGDTDAHSILHPDVCGGSHAGLLAVHSLSKSSNLAGYRAGFIAGDPALVATLLEVRKHAGMMVPFPVQAAMTAAASDDAHVAVQAARYERRRAVLRPALEKAGLAVEHSDAGLYLWATAGEPCRLTVRRLADEGVLVAPGEFYGPAGARHVRVGADGVRRADRDGSPAPRPAVTRGRPEAVPRTRPTSHPFGALRTPSTPCDVPRRGARSGCGK